MSLLTTEQQNRIIHAISVAENMTSGEIRVAIEKSSKGPVLNRAKHLFERLKMHETVLKNGVLIYIATEDKELAIIGDRGIHKHVEQQFWENTKTTVLDFFKKGLFSEGIECGIQIIAEKLHVYFPVIEGDVNELPNEIYFGE